MPENCDSCPAKSMFEKLGIDIATPACQTKIDACPGYGENGAICSNLAAVSGLVEDVCGFSCAKAGNCITKAANDERSPAGLGKAFDPTKVQIV